LTNKNVFSCLLNWEKLSDDRSEAGSLFQSRSSATSNGLSPRRVLDHGMTHVMASDKRRQRLASGIDLHASEIRQLMYGRNGRHDMLLSQQD